MRKVAFLVLPEFSYFGLAAATEPLFVANWLTQRPAFEWSVVSVDGLAVRASNGRRVEVDGDLASVAGARSVFVLASFDPQGVVGEPRVARWLKRLARFGVELIGLENGSLVLAACGLLHGREVAVHWDNALGFQEHHPTSRAVSQLYVRGAQRVSCAGAAAVLDLMIAWIGWHADAGLAAEVAEHLLIAPRAGSTPQRVGGRSPGAPRDPALLEAQRLMLRHLEEPLDCGAIARRVGLSIRQLERRCRQELGRTLIQHYQRVRIAKAHQLLQQTELTVTEVALACGFSSPEYFSRVYRTLLGCAPSRDRRQTTSAPVLRVGNAAKPNAAHAAVRRAGARPASG